MWKVEKTFKSYLYATVAVLVAFSIRYLIPQSIIYEIPFLLFFSAIVFSGITGGFWTGAYASILSALISYFFFITPIHTFQKNNWHQELKLALFIFDCLTMSAVCGKLRNSFQLNEKLRMDLQKVIGDLTTEKDLRERFVAALSHDLRTPLTVAKMSSQLLAKHPDHEKTVDIANRITKNIDRADNMIRDLLDAKLISAGQGLFIKKIECTLNDIIGTVVENLSTAHGSRFEFHSENVVHGHFDPGAITRLVENLCTNAIKYGAQGKKVKVSLVKADNVAKIAVHNEGHPIPPEDLPKIFDQYKRVNENTREQQIGWGIGLTLVRGIAVAHGGEVTVQSSANDGTTFTAILPLR